MYLFKRQGHKNVAAATRHDACHPEESLDVLLSRIEKETTVNPKGSEGLEETNQVGQFLSFDS